MDEEMEQEEKDEKNVEEKMKEEKPGEGQSDSDEDENLLATAPGEEEGEDVEETVTTELLKDTDEIETKQQAQPSEFGQQRTLNIAHAQTAAQHQSNGSYEARMSGICGEWRD